MNVYDLLSAYGEDKDLLRKGGLLSTHGRVLVLLLADPTITQIAVSVILGVSPSAVEKSVAFWSDAGILKADKSGRNNVYTVDRKALDEHPDLKIVKLLLEHD